MDINKIITELKISDEIIAIFPYGSRVYGFANENSDEDYIIVIKNAFLKSGSFRDNAISNEDKSIQGVLYSRTGFIDAINNYNMPAMECLSLEKDIIFNKWKFAVYKWDEKELIKKVIQQSSASWHIATEQSKNGFKDRAKKGIFHSLRILDFGLQLKENKKIINFQSCNDLYYEINDIENFDDRNYISFRDNLVKKLKGY